MVVLLTLDFPVCGADNRLAVNIKNLADNIAKHFGETEIRIAAVQGEQVYLKRPEGINFYLGGRCLSNR